MLEKIFISDWSKWMMKRRSKSDITFDTMGKYCDDGKEFWWWKRTVIIEGGGDDGKRLLWWKGVLMMEKDCYDGKALKRA